MPAAAIEASVFPAPTEVIFLACAAVPGQRVTKLLALTLCGAALGSVAGWWLGGALAAAPEGAIAWPQAVRPYVAQVLDAYRRYPLLALSTSGFTPIPFAAYTVVAGSAAMPLPTLLVGAVAGRAAKYLLLSGVVAAVWQVVRRRRGDGTT